MILGAFWFFPFSSRRFSIRYLPLGQFKALINLSPLILTIFAAGWLGEKVGRRETISLLLGFSDMLICIRPEFSYLSLLALAPLLDAVSVVFGSALKRKYLEEPTLNWIFNQEMSF